jgi:hypothetical protein
MEAIITLTDAERRDPVDTDRGRHIATTAFCRPRPVSFPTVTRAA